MQPNKHIKSDLEHLADLGYSAFPDAEKDVEILKQKVRARVKENFLNSSGFMAIAVSLFMGITCFFTVYNSPILSPSRFEILTAQTKKDLVQNISLDTISVHANLKSDKHEKFSEPTHLDTSLLFGKAEELATINEINLGNTINPDQFDIKYSPNAPYIYLYDLKVANYNGYYFKTPKRVITHGGIEANKDAKNTQEPGMQTPNQEYYLHEVIKDAMRLFKDGKFTACISKFDLASEYSKNDVNCDFYRGICYYQLGNNAQAYTYFSSALSNPINVFIEEAAYYKAMASLKLGKESEAKEMFTVIAANKGFYSKKAEEQLIKM